MADQKYLAFILLLYLFNLVNSSSLCNDAFCTTYIHETGCTAPANDCDINNATISGMRMPSPTVCNCCQFCLPFFGDGEHCSTGGSGTGLTIGRCGNGLTCALDPDTEENRCTRMTSTCHTSQDNHDSLDEAGTLGMLQERPICDGKGRPGPVQCVTAQTCFCQSDEGKRIFGEAAYVGPSTLRNMQCRCSQIHDKIEKNIYPGTPAPVLGPRCTIDGNFNPVQCIDRTCYCVDRITGLIINRIDSIDLDTHNITRLPCYDADLDAFPRYNQGDPPYNYTTPCLEDRNEMADLILESIEAGFNVDFGGGYTKCYPDGTFGQIVQSRTGAQICVDNLGRQIGDYQAMSETDDFDKMDCKCAMTTYLMGAATEKPVCCKNGNFRPIQCRRGLCYCVDSDGRQITKEESNVRRLSCWTAQWIDC